MRGRALGAAFAALFVSACATAPPPRVEWRAPPNAPSPALLPGWAADDHLAAWNAFRASCGASRDANVEVVCREARATGPLTAGEARRFFEAHFIVEALPGEGVLTAYFAPEYPARRQPSTEFSAPVRPKPNDLDLARGPYAERAAVEAAPLKVALAWMRPEDLFFLQVQGSGVLVFEDGRRAKALYAANNGRPYVAIGGLMRERGLLAADDASAEAIHAWLAAHRGPEADALMRLNPRYAFFALAPDDGRPPTGTANIPLPAGRALAVDPAFHAMGALLWIDADRPRLKGARPSYRRLALALDTGGAIKGEVRADLFLGQGAAAGAEAGRVRHTLRLYRLVARPAP